MLRAEGPLPLWRAARLVGDLLSALEQVHAVGVVHGDVKCANIIVTRSREGADRAKLVDFGAARSFRPPSHMRAAMSCGTPEYIAPEVIAGEPATPLADVYGVGVVLYELVCGRPPFGGRTPLETLWRQTNDEIVIPSLRAGRRVSRRLDSLIMKALAKTPSERWQTPASMAVALVDAMSLGDDPDNDVSRTLGSGDHEEERKSTPREIAQRDHMLRVAISDAIRDGDTQAIARLYQSLALELSRAGNPKSAAAELREAIDILTFDSDGRNQRAVRSLEVLLDTLTRAERPPPTTTS